MQGNLSVYRNGVANKLQDDDSAAHRWYRLLKSIDVAPYALCRLHAFVQGGHQGET